MEEIGRLTLDIVSNQLCGHGSNGGPRCGTRRGEAIVEVDGAQLLQYARSVGTGHPHECPGVGDVDDDHASAHGSVEPYRWLGTRRAEDRP